MIKTNLEVLQDELRAGASADIWFDADGPDDEAAFDLICKTQTAMHDATVLLGDMRLALVAARAHIEALTGGDTAPDPAALAETLRLCQKALDNADKPIEIDG